MALFPPGRLGPGCQVGHWAVESSTVLPVPGLNDLLQGCLPIVIHSPPPTPLQFTGLISHLTGAWVQYLCVCNGRHPFGADYVESYSRVSIIKSYKHPHIDINQPYKYFGLQTRSWSRTDSINIVFHFYCFELVSIAIIVSMTGAFSFYERSCFGFVEILFVGQETREHWVLHSWLILLYLDSRTHIKFFF